MLEKKTLLKYNVKFGSKLFKSGWKQNKMCNYEQQNKLESAENFHSCNYTIGSKVTTLSQMLKH